MAPNDSEQRKQRILLVAAIVLLVAAGAYAWLRLGGESPAGDSRSRWLVCAETGKAYEKAIEEGETEPFMSPFTDRQTGYLAEPCYWTAEGKAKLEPTWVLVKTRVDPNTTEKTYCPDCGKEVVGHNPMPPDELMAEARAAAGQ